MLFRLPQFLLSMLVVAVILSVSAGAQTFTTLYNFDGDDGYTVVGALVQGLDGNFYGTTHEGGISRRGTLFQITLSGQLTNLWLFCTSGSPQSAKPGICPGGL